MIQAEKYVNGSQSLLFNQVCSHALSITVYGSSVYVVLSQSLLFNQVYSYSNTLDALSRIVDFVSIPSVQSGLIPT